MKEFENLVEVIVNFVWGPPLIILLIGTHIFLTFRLKFIQKYIFKAIKLSYTKDVGSKGDISQFGALTTAMAATLGTGNIIGVSTAIALGGPGAVLWMWLTGVFGISTKYAEAVLAIKYRVQKPDGSFAGGPMYALEKGLGQRWLAVLFSIFTVITAFVSMNMVQSNSIATMVHASYDIPMWITGLVLTGMTAIVIIGGIKSIARVCKFLIPFMAIFYILGCVYILIMNMSGLPATVELIVTSAFSGQAAIGGFVGAGIMQALRYGVARGLFSNESGLGSAPIVAAAAQTKNPVRQALISATGTFWDTVIVCALTGLVIVNSGDWHLGLNGAALTKSAFEEIPVVGSLILSVGLITFVFSTILGWSYYGEKALEYLVGTKIIPYYRVVWVLMVFLGSVLSLNVVWNMADISNGLMAIPNLISVIFLSGIIVKETEKYLWNKRLDASEEDFE